MRASSFRKTLREKNLRKTELWKKKGKSPAQHPRKKRTAFPLKHITVQTPMLVGLHGESIISLMRVSNPVRLAGLEDRKKNKKKPWGGDKNVQCEKRPVRGQEKNAPFPDKKALDAVRPKVPVTLCKPHKFQENPKNARGPEWHPEKNAEKRDARPKRAKQQARRDTKREKEQAKRCVWGCPVTT